MKDTAFSVSAESISRLATAYQLDGATGQLVVADAPKVTGAGRRRSNQAAAGSSRPPRTTSPSPRPCSPAEPTVASGYSRGRR